MLFDDKYLPMKLANDFMVFDKVQGVLGEVPARWSILGHKIDP